LGGLQMLCLGVVGGYIGKIYSEVKQRPRYLIVTHIMEKKEETD
ncbi:MAG: glycosyltransferase, partial [Ruminococcus bromii]|nr:glycosyltransferase [Ruminococcus bromii]